MAVALGGGVVVAVAFLGTSGIVAVVAAGLASAAIGRFMSLRLGGITGDVLGATIELSELTVLLAVSAWTHGPR